MDSEPQTPANEQAFSDAYYLHKAQALMSEYPTVTSSKCATISRLLFAFFIIGTSFYAVKNVVI